GSRQASVTSWSRSASRRENAVPQEPPPTTTTFTSGASHEVDRDRNPFELEAVSQLVLDPVPVVARDQPGVVDEEGEPRRAGARLRAVEQVQALAAARGRLPCSTQLLQEAVQLGSGDAPRVLRVQLLDPVEQASDAAAGLRRDGDDPGPLAKLTLDPR